VGLEDDATDAGGRRENESIQFQPGLSMPQFLERYATEAQCQTALQAAR
jgi:hypothetical protein